MSEQIAYKLDAVSLKKMGKGMLYAILPSVLLGVITYLQDTTWTSAIANTLMPYIIMILTNAAKEWIKGVPK